MRVFAVCAFAVMTATSAFAEPAAVAVRFNRAALNDPAAVEALHARIVHAARKACEADNRLSSYGWAFRLQCVTEQTDKAVRTANIPALTVLHASLSQTSPG